MVIRNSENMHLPKYRTNKLIREKVDKILHNCAMIYANLGTNTSLDLKTEERAKKTEAKWLKEIKNLDPIIYERVKKDV